MCLLSIGAHTWAIKSEDGNLVAISDLQLALAVGSCDDSDPIDECAIATVVLQENAYIAVS